MVSTLAVGSRRPKFHRVAVAVAAAVLFGIAHRQEYNPELGCIPTEGPIRLHVN
jgi:hypothetical protein